MKRKPSIEPSPEKKRKTVETMAARYPLQSLFAGLAHRQPSTCVSTSSQGLVVCSPPRPNALSLYSVSSDLYTLNPSLGAPATAKKVPLRLAEAHHQHTLSHIQWHQNGTTLATADETGKIALWHLENSVENWSLTYEVDLKQPLASFFWLNAERQYTSRETDDQGCVFTRETVVGPRNPFGYLAFVAVTAHGEVSVHFQRNGSIFSSFTTTLPLTGHRDTCRSDTGCYGMALAGLEDWERLSHASMAFDNEGDLYLATFYAELPKTVYLYKINLRFPHKTNDGAIHCQHVTELSFVQPPTPLEPVAQPETPVTHILLSNDPQGLLLHVAFGNQETSYFGKWRLQPTTQQIPSHYFDGYSASAITNECIDFHHIYGFALDKRLITSAHCTSSGLVALGLSDGSIHMEFQQGQQRLQRYHAEKDSSSIYRSFWQVTDGYLDADGFADPVVGIAFSPSETHLVYMLASGRIGTSRLTQDLEENGTEDDIHVTRLEQALKLSLLNRRDNLDLISEVIRLGRQANSQDLPDRITNNVLSALESFNSQTNINHLVSNQADTPEFSLSDEMSLAKIGHAYGFAIGVYRRLPSKKFAFTNLTKALQLPIILECFIGSCTSKHTDIATALDVTTGDEAMSALTFNPESLWSLVYLSMWVLDYTRWVLKEWNVLFNSRHPEGSDISTRASHAVLLVHRASRLALMKILVMIQQFSQFTLQGQYDMTQLTETKPMLEREVKIMTASIPVAIDDVLVFLKALHGTAGQLDQSGHNNSLAILIKAQLPAVGPVLDGLKKVTSDYRSKCAVPSIYLEKHQDHPVDVIRKRRIALTEKRVRTCMRCYQLYLPENPDVVDPSAYSTWFHSMTRRCVCGGIFC
ncbi:hypothetical protein DM01DRAFT_1332468 [Hesseltinella vesiculosa]|uniref:Mediator of RNA polymerase II transcription subunit 16 n=1 Tax=Hesseltinella vesiculosa TaxID=101127 RepID=A0A1X2GS97_9FUNG|nr:hypothetical protein DM01DRAFT_1332468 [Hesseltinella vesiculosa]